MALLLSLYLDMRYVDDGIVSSGQRVRGWIVEWSEDGGKTWNPFANGKSVGNKRIALSPTGANLTATHLRLNISASIGASNVTMKAFASCPTA